MSIVYLNGEFVEDNTPLINHHDSGFTTGIGIFDSMLAKDGSPIHIKEHFERIIYDVSVVLNTPYPNIFNILPSPLNKGGGLGKGDPQKTKGIKDFTNIVETLLKKNNLANDYARIRTTVTGGEVTAPLAPAKSLTVLIDAKSCDGPDDIKPITCAIITDFPRIAGCVLENCKRLDYSRSYAARRAAEALGAQEAILTNTDGNIACAATSNIFIEENGTLITPPLSDGALAGTTRRKILEKSPPLHLNPPPFKGGRKESSETAFRWGDVKEVSISTNRLKNAEKIFLTNSFIGLRGVTLLR